MKPISAGTIARGIVNQALGHAAATETNISVATLLLGIEEALVAHVDEPVAWLYEVDAGTDNACWVVCARGDPGARAVFLHD